MTNYYGYISALGVCANIAFISAMYVRGDIGSNDLGIANKLVDALPELVKDVSNKTYEMHNGGK